MISDLIELLNIEDDTIKKLDFKLKTPRSNFCSTFANSKLHIIGGYNGKEIVNQFEYFDNKQKKWIDLTKMPYKKKDFCVVSGIFNKNLYVIGGIDNNEYIQTLN